jgi:uncharacterized protein YacL
MNWLERMLPEKARMKISTLIAAALGLFLGLRYNEYISKLIAKFVPAGGSLLIEGAILIGITFVIVYLAVLVEKALDGK